MSDFSDLLRRAKSGDANAQGELLRRYETRVDRAIRRRMGVSGGALRRQHDTSDLRQSVFREVLLEIPRINDFGEKAFLHLLYLKAATRVARAQRKVLGPESSKKMGQLGTGAGAEQEAPGPGPATRAEGRDQSAADTARLDRALAAMTAPQRELVKLHSDGATFKEIAERLHLPSEDAARMQHARALKELARRCRHEPN